MRILYVIDSLAPGGAETSLAAMVPGFVRGGLDLHVLSLGPRLDLGPAIEQAGGTVHAHRSAGRLQNVREVLNVARRTRPDLLHTTLFESDVAGRAAAWRLGLPVSTSIVSDSYGPAHYAHHNRAKLHVARTLDAVTAVYATRFHAISTAIADSVSPRLGIPRHKVDVIPRGRDPHAFAFQPPDLRERTRHELGLPASVPVIVSIGRLEPEKGHRHLLAALPIVAEEHPDVVTLIAGKDGRSAVELRSLAGDMPNEVRFLGHRADVAGLLAAADVFCFPSEREGLGGALIEALAVGCPIVASRIPTTLEVLSAGGSSIGTVVDAHDPAELGRALSRSLRGDEDTRHLAREGRRRFEESYSINSVVLRMIGFFERAAGGHSGRPDLEAV